MRLPSLRKKKQKTEAAARTRDACRRSRVLSSVVVTRALREMLRFSDFLSEKQNDTLVSDRTQTRIFQSNPVESVQLDSCFSASTCRTQHYEYNVKNKKIKKLKF